MVAPGMKPDMGGVQHCLTKDCRIHHSFWGCCRSTNTQTCVYAHECPHISLFLSCPLSHPLPPSLSTLISPPHPLSFSLFLYPPPPPFLPSTSLFFSLPPLSSPPPLSQYLYSPPPSPNTLTPHSPLLPISLLPPPPIPLLSPFPNTLTPRPPSPNTLTPRPPFPNTLTPPPPPSPNTLSPPPPPPPASPNTLSSPQPPPPTPHPPLLPIPFLPTTPTPTNPSPPLLCLFSASPVTEACVTAETTGVTGGCSADGPCRPPACPCWGRRGRCGTAGTGRSRRRRRRPGPRWSAPGGVAVAWSTFAPSPAGRRGCQTERDRAELESQRPGPLWTRSKHKQATATAASTLRWAYWLMWCNCLIFVTLSKDTFVSGHNQLQTPSTVLWHRQLHGDKECPSNGVTKSGRVWRKVLESDAQSVNQLFSLLLSVLPAVTISRNIIWGIYIQYRSWTQIPASFQLGLMQSSVHHTCLQMSLILQHTPDMPPPITETR